MRNRLIALFTILIVSGLIIGCGGGGKSNNPQPQAQAPATATLSFPAQNSLCVSGTVISDTQSAITFTWNTAANADSYELDIKNLLTGVTTTQTSSMPQLTVTLLRNTPFSWFVVSKSSKTSATATSDIWKFFNAGLGTTSHVPFPADLVSPAFGQTLASGATTVDLSWAGSDVDNDIASYDVYLSADANPKLLKSGVTDMFLKTVPVAAKTTYYWKVVTTDSQGNISTSDISQFTTN